MLKDGLTPFAGRNGVRTLYRFMRYPSGDAGHEARDRVLKLIQHGELYFPLARQLNDPFEAAPRFRVPEALDELLQWYESLASRNGEEGKVVEAKRLQIIERFESGHFQVEAESRMRRYRAMFREVPVCCFSATRESILMWSYYADGHKGLCVHFDSLEPAPFAAAQLVVYQDEYPLVQVPVQSDGAALFTLAFLTKSKAWKHEREYRLINLFRDGLGDPSSPRILDDHFKWRAPQLARSQLRHVCSGRLGRAWRAMR